MERFTEYHNGVAVIKNKSKHKEAMERLAFCEDLEETLENTLKGYVTIKDFILMNAEWFKMMNTEPELADAMMITNEEVKKYKEWRRLEEQGLLLKLPCKVGDMSYHPSSFWNRVFEYAVISISVDKENIWIKCGNGYSFILGREIFLTKAEAEKALAEMEK